MEDGNPDFGIRKERQFVAHADRVNCVVQGPKSKQLFATGGDDGRVNLWRVDRANCLGSLNISKSFVESACFDQAEKVLAAGTRSGSIQLFSLSSGKKLQSSLAGHRSACSALSFHPLGNYLSSGSKDPNVKIWDIRRKNCVQTFKGHSGTITCLKHSPGGTWLTSASEDGTVCIWDLNTGKLFKQINAHSGSITALEFHQRDRVMATCGTDKIAKVWGLDGDKDSDLLFCTPKHRSTIRAICFAQQDPDQLYCATDNGLKVWKLEEDYNNDASTCKALAQLDHSWKTVQTISMVDEDENEDTISKSSMILSTRGSTVAIWSAQLNVDDSNSNDDYGLINRSHNATDVHKREQVLIPKRKNFTKQSSGDTLPKEQLSNVKSFESKKKNRESVVNAAKRSVLVPSMTQRNTEEPLDISYSNFLPKSLAITGDANSDTIGESTTSTKARLATELIKGHDDFMHAISMRLDEIDHLESLWNNGKPKQVIDHLITTDNNSVAADFLKHVNLKSGFVNLDICGKILPLVVKLLSSMFEDHIKIALKTGTFLFKSFSPIIKSTIHNGKISSENERAIDIAKEERLKKCKLCRQGFKHLLQATCDLLQLHPDTPNKLDSSESKDQTNSTFGRSTLRDAKHLRDSLREYLS